MKAATLLLISILSVPMLASSQGLWPQTSDAREIVVKTSPVLVTVLAGQGEKVEKMGTGIVIGNDGVVITSYSLIEDARSLQVRYGNKLYEGVVLLAYDQARDLAAVRIAATNLPLPNIRTEVSSPGEPIFVIWMHGRKEPSIALGRLKRLDSFTRPDSNHQFNLLDFDAPLLSPLPGAALVDADGRILGMVMASWGTTRAHQAVPMSALLQFSKFSGRVFESGSELRLENDPMVTPASLHNVQPGKLANYNRTYAVNSATILIERDLMLEALRNQRDFAALDFVLVENRELAEVFVEVAYVPWTFDYTFKVIDQRTSVVIGAGKITAFNGYLAAPALAKKIAEQMKKWRSQATVTTVTKEGNPN